MSAARTVHAARTRPPVRTFRPDIEGLRAVAVLAVVLYHAHLGVRGGFVGVDVFFVISGFLITRQLTASIGSRGLAALPRFYSRRIRRLLPAAAVVVVVTIGAARIWAPPLQVRSITWDGLFTTFYGLNYRLAVLGTDYQHQGDAVSPLQHFWSLAVEEQFYIVWPLMVVLLTVLGRRHRRAALALVLTTVITVSFLYSVKVTAQLPSWAYFSLHTRAWELALGGLVAVGAARLTTMPRLLGEAGAALGLVLVVVSAFAYSDDTTYPGAYAAVPVAGTALVIATGCGPRRRAERVLAEPLMQCLGRVSYAWYLWHWPMLIIAPMIVGHTLSVPQRCMIVWFSLAAAVASYFFVEEPGRRLGSRNWQGFGAGLLLSAGVVATALLVLTNLPSLVGGGRATHVVQADTATSSVLHDQQRAVAAGVALTASPANLTPNPQKAHDDLPAADGSSCHASFTTIEQGPCVYGDPDGTRTAVLVGDSHADMWLAAFARAGRAQHWRIVDWTKSACPAARITVRNAELNRTYTECDTWRERVVARIDALHPDAVFLSDSENVVGPSVSPSTWSGATLATMRALRSGSGARVTLLQDVPVPAYDMPSCVAQHLSAVNKCTFAVDRAYSFPARHRELAASVSAAGYQVVEPRPWICTADTCPAVVGNMLVYRDDTHLTDTFSAWLAPRVSTLLSAAPR